jgi:hypothetical protein
MPHLCPGLYSGQSQTTPNLLSPPALGLYTWRRLQVDFIHMPAPKKLKYLLTLVDTLSRWVEVFPTTGESAEVVATHLIKDIIL